MRIFKHRDICGLVGTLCGACIVTLVALCFGTAPARAQNFNMFPSQLAFISNGKYFGKLEIQGLSLPITGTLAYLVSGPTTYLHISIDPTEAQLPTGEQLITSDTWLVQTSTAVNQWEIASTFPTICRKEVLSGASYPQSPPPPLLGQCEWFRTPKGDYRQQCSVTAQGKQATLFFDVVLNNATKQFVEMEEQANITDENDNSQVTNVIGISVTSQGTTPPAVSDFNRPSICTSNNQGENDNSQSTAVGPVCTGTIPNICF
jgi:hypothetical protein